MNRLKELREDRGIRQQDVADALGVHFTTVSKYEIGTNDLPTEMIAKLCRFYGVTADYLLGLSNNPHAAVSESDSDLLRAYHAAPLEIRKIIDTALAPYAPVSGQEASAAS